MELTGAVQRNARRSADNGGECVESAALTGGAAVLDRQEPDRQEPDRPGTCVHPEEWTALIARVKAGSFCPS
jgi:uncharacterized protein DUF397